MFLTERTEQKNMIFEELVSILKIAFFIKLAFLSFKSSENYTNLKLIIESFKDFLKPPFQKVIFSFF